MRKIDYSTLAHIIRDEVRIYSNLENATAFARVATAIKIAARFSNRASVNKVEFLAACGIDAGMFDKYNIDPLG